MILGTNTHANNLVCTDTHRHRHTHRHTDTHRQTDTHTQRFIKQLSIYNKYNSMSVSYVKVLKYEVEVSFKCFISISYTPERVWYPCYYMRLRCSRG